MHLQSLLKVMNCCLVIPRPQKVDSEVSIGGKEKKNEGMEMDPVKAGNINEGFDNDTYM